MGDCSPGGRKRLYPIDQLLYQDGVADQIQRNDPIEAAQNLSQRSSGYQDSSGHVLLDVNNSEFLATKKAKIPEFLDKETYDRCLNETSITSEKRIGYLLNLLKEKVETEIVTKEVFYYISQQYVAKLIEDKKWTGLSTEKAISLALLSNYKTKSNKVNHFNCAHCALSYPRGKHECDQCEMTFTVEMFLFAHQVNIFFLLPFANNRLDLPFSYAKSVIFCCDFCYLNTERWTCFFFNWLATKQYDLSFAVKSPETVPTQIIPLQKGQHTQHI